MLVFDASTLILLTKIDLLEIMTKEVEIQIPQAVAQEVTTKENLWDARYIRRLIEDGSVKVVRRQDPLAVQLVRDFHLAVGEASAIALAKVNQCILGVDDRQVMSACKILGVHFATALAFLVRAYEKHLLSQELAVAKWNKLKEYGWYSPTLLTQALNHITGGEHP